MSYTPRPPSDEEIEAAFAGLEKSYEADRWDANRCLECGNYLGTNVFCSDCVGFYEDLKYEAHREGLA